LGAPNAEKAVIAASATLGERVRSARKELGLSQAQLAGEELTKGFISQLESGLVRPSIRSLQLLATRLSKPLDYFLGDVPLATGKRVAFHRLAAETAVEQRDWTSVREHVERGLAESPEAKERARFLSFLAEAEFAQSDFEKTFDLVARGLETIDSATDAPLVATLLFLRGSAYGAIGQLVAATESLEASRDLIERYEVFDPRLRSRLMVALGTAYRRLKRSSKALSSYESALATASRHSERLIAARGYMGIAATHYDSGELDAAISNYRRALDLFLRVADVDRELDALQSIATVQLEDGKVREAKLSGARTGQRSLRSSSRASTSAKGAPTKR